MHARLIATIVGACILALTGGSGARAQPAAPPAQAAVTYPPEQLDQMLAPIALYPDPLLAQVLMAATYPLEVVEADRWVSTPANAALAGQRLAAALDPEPWDPSVKSLVPFPPILHMMDANLGWTEQLGEAFVANQAAVMDSVQRLRQRAETAGRLASTPQQVVTKEGPYIEIEPPGPETVYLPVYDPSFVYGVWPYPAYAPYYFPGYFPAVTVVGAIGYGWLSVTVAAPLWGWNHWNWSDHRIDLDRERFAALNGNRPPPGTSWQFDPEHRRGVPYRTPALRERFASQSLTPEAQRGFRGYPTNRLPDVRPAPTPALPHVIGPSAPQPPVFESFGPGTEVRAETRRGIQSRIAAQRIAPKGGAAAHEGAHR